MRKELRALLAALVLCTPLVAATSSLAAASRRQKGQEPKTQQELVREVRHQLVLLPYYSVFDNLAYRVEGDKVILEGQVTRPTLKSDAEGVVKNIPGITAVVNDIEVLPLSPLDDQIRRATYRTVYGETALFRYAQSPVPSVHIIVKNGNVTLEGVVDTESDKNLADLRANAVPNVFSVRNNLVVSSGK
jgi:hyperosmotically inducible protein